MPRLAGTLLLLLLLSSCVVQNFPRGTFFCFSGLSSFLLLLLLLFFFADCCWWLWFPVWSRSWLGHKNSEVCASVPVCVCVCGLWLWLCFFSSSLSGRFIYNCVLWWLRADLTFSQAISQPETTGDDDKLHQQHCVKTATLFTAFNTESVTKF